MVNDVVTAVALADQHRPHSQRLGGGYIVIGAVSDHDGILGGASCPGQGAAEQLGIGLVHPLLGGGTDDLEIPPQTEPCQPLL